MAPDLHHRAAPLSAFALDPGVVHLNHGSFGACPIAVLDAQQAWRARIEAATMRFFVLDWQDAIDAARVRLAAFLRAPVDGLVFVPNATTGVATALDALVGAGDELVTTDHAYAACRNQLDRLAATRDARVVIARIETPVRDPGQHVAALLAAVTDATRLVLLDHVTSPTALILDVASIARELAPRGIHVVIDGAHAPGMLDLDVGALGALGVAAYVGNLHKWVCAPKGCGFLWVRDDLRERVRPLVASHGHHAPMPCRFWFEHDWTGTHDPTPYLSVPAAIDEIARLGGDWPTVRARGHALALAMRDALGARLGVAAAAPASMIGTMAAIPVTMPDGVTGRAFERTLLERGWEVAIATPASGGTFVRVAAHLYNQLDEAEQLGDLLSALGVRGSR